MDNTRTRTSVSAGLPPEPATSAGEVVPRLRVKLWLDMNGENAFGMGSFILLQGVENTGSLAGAAKQLGMSYRTAWGRIRKIEERLGRAVLEKRGGNKAGYSLTEFGTQCLASYETISTLLHEVADREFAKHFAAIFDSTTK